VEIVAVAPAAEAVGAFEKFIADAGVPLGSDGGEIGHGMEMEVVGVVGADNHGEGVLEAERFGEIEIETLGVLLLHAIVDGGGVICSRGFVENGGEGGAGIFNVEIEVAGEERFVDQESATEIGFALDGDVCSGFDVLGEEFGEDDLLGEKF